MSVPYPNALPVEPAQADTFLSEPSEGLVKSLESFDEPVLVLGAGGKMGLHLCRMLRRVGELRGKELSVTAVSRFRTVHGRESFEEAGVKTLPCELEDEAALKALPEASHVVFMAGAKFGTTGQPDILQRMNVELPKKVAQRYSKSRILAFSTGCVYSMVDPQSGGSTEKDPTDPPGEYALSCLGREQAFATEAREHGTEVCLIRLNYSTEFRYGVLVDICQKIMSGQEVNLDMGWVNLIWQRDAVDHILRTFPLANSEARPINITGTGIHAVRDLALKLGQRLDMPVTFSGREGQTAWLNDASEAHKLFGPPQTSLDTMLDWTAAWAQQVGQTFGKPTGFEKRSGKF